MMRRSVLVPGKLPIDGGDSRPTGQMRDPSANEMQLQALQDSPEMQTVMKQVCELHNNVAEVVKELIYRKDLAIKVDTANRAYVELFEKMLSEVLKIQRQRFKVHFNVLNICSCKRFALTSLLSLFVTTISAEPEIHC